jgi:molecular chaperone Hsp33
MQRGRAPEKTTLTRPDGARVIEVQLGLLRDSTLSTPAKIVDRSVRAMTDDGAFRVIVARSTETVRGICRTQQACGATARTLGNLLTATALFRETMSPNLRVQGILRGADGRGTLVADSGPNGRTRGLIKARPENGGSLRPDGALLQMMRTLHNGSVNQGVVRVPEGGTVSEAMMAYMKESEQVDTMLAVSTIMGSDGEIVAAGGYMVQLLPEVGRGPLEVMAARLEDFKTIEHLLNPDFTPEWLRDELLYGMPFTVLDTTELSFSCWCSENRLLGALATLPKHEIQSMIDDAKPLEITCDYCLKDYSIQPARLSGLLRQN